jgi:hypothetical protein
MAAKTAGVEKGAGAGATAPATLAGRGAGERTFGAVLGEDIGAVTSFGWVDERCSRMRTHLNSTRRVVGEEDYGRYNSWGGDFFRF